MTTTTRLPQMVAVDDLAMTLGVCTKTVRRWIKDGKLRAHHLGRRVLIAEEDAAAFIAGPIRRQNLVALDIQQHIECHRSGTVYLTIPGAQVKNGVDIEAILPPSLVKLMDLYLAQYRPLLDPGNTSSWLFPGWPRRHKSRERFASQIRDTIKQQTGLLVNVHLFRAIAAKIYLDRNPGGYGVVKHLHGHKSLATTIRSYCGLEGKKTIAHYDQLITEKRNAPLPTRRRKVA